jgi:hypothetical protein
MNECEIQSKICRGKESIQMAIKFAPRELLLTESQTNMSNDGKSEYTKVKFADEGAFESEEFFLPRGIDPKTLKVKARYIVGVEVSGGKARLYFPTDEQQLKLNKSQP